MVAARANPRRELQDRWAVAGSAVGGFDSRVLPPETNGGAPPGQERRRVSGAEPAPTPSADDATARGRHRAIRLLEKPDCSEPADIRPPGIRWASSAPRPVGRGARCRTQPPAGRLMPLPIGRWRGPAARPPTRLQRGAVRGDGCRSWLTARQTGGMRSEEGRAVSPNGAKRMQGLLTRLVLRRGRWPRWVRTIRGMPESGPNGVPAAPSPRAPRAFHGSAWDGEGRARRGRGPTGRR